jgi:hypothetical protein
MPPHCDTLDGPVVTAARRALEAHDVNLVLPYVHEDSEDEVVKAFNKVSQIRREGTLEREIADLHFFEIVVRVHRAGEGAPYTGLKPAGLDVGPVIPAAEKAIETGHADDLVRLLTDTVRHEVTHRLQQVTQLKRHAGGTVAEARAYVQAMLGLQGWAHKVYETATATARAHDEDHEHGAVRAREAAHVHA